MLKSRYILSLIPLVLALLATACSDKELDPTPAAPSAGDAVDRFPGYSLNVVATLDNMGGGDPALADDPEEVTKWENYIDPEKFRVLFFTSQDSFLFESKSRWVKKLNPSSDFSKYQVSVPIHTYGNDYYDGYFREYNWENIRKRLTTDTFKIAILANRPEMDYFPDYKNGGENTPPGWYNNQGPFWGPDNSVATEGAVKENLKTVFDLHHTQFDPIYHNKNAKGSGKGFYAPFMKNPSESHNSGDPSSGDSYAGDSYNLMGSTKAWVLGDIYDTRVTADVTNGQPNKRFFVLPSASDPIPMYGIQKFAPIPNWEEGTPFNLSSDIDDGYVVDEYKKDMQSISLLRSAVRVDLLVPKRYSGGTAYNEPLYVGLAYSNTNSRCEPMDVWNPTNEVWTKEHGTVCEWDRIRAYGPIADGDVGSPQKYQQKLAWFYGAWIDQGWNFNKGKYSEDFGYSYIDSTYVKSLKSTYGDFPRVFNGCIQRNAFVFVDHKGNSRPNTNQNPYWEDDGYWHYVAYVGERNVNDPSTLGSNSTNASGNTIIYWILKVPANSAKSSYTSYAVPITKYFTDLNSTSTPNAGTSLEIQLNSMVNNYANNIASGYSDKTRNPFPLLRNHVYRIKLGQPGSKSASRSVNEKPIDFNPILIEAATHDITCR